MSARKPTRKASSRKKTTARKMVRKKAVRKKAAAKKTARKKAAGTQTVRKKTVRKKTVRKKAVRKTVARKPATRARTAGKKGVDSKMQPALDLAAEKRRMRTILARLERAYPDARCSLNHDSPLQLAIATILSAQCTDARVNMVTPRLFERYPTAEALADADFPELEEIIRSTGFFRNKAKNIVGCAQELVERHGGEVPQNLDSLVQLAGIGRKTANVVLGNAFGIPGVVVDTHVGRISGLLNLTAHKDPNKIERDLMQVVPRSKWTQLAHLFIEHGRNVCIARRPRCADCVLNDLCPSSEV